MEPEEAEGWYVDPFGVHEARWFSVGIPTALVRDGEVECQDPPPRVPIRGRLVSTEESTSGGGDDLRRADESVDDPLAEWVWW